jgi:hypothetical protein
MDALDELYMYEAYRNKNLMHKKNIITGKQEPDTFGHFMSSISKTFSKIR